MKSVGGNRELTYISDNCDRQRACLSRVPCWADSHRKCSLFVYFI